MKVGLTGHQNIGSESDVDWVRVQLAKQIDLYSVIEGFSCLAVGSDQLYAEILNEKKISLTAIIPSERYEKTFKEKSDFRKYERLLSKAKEIVKLNYSSPTEEAFYAAGKEVVNRSNMMFAIWNGKKAEGLGGTADIVDYAQQQNKKVVHINPANRTVSEITFHDLKESMNE